MALSDRYHALAARAVGHPRDRAHETAGPPGQLAFQLARDRFDLLAHGAHFLRNDSEPRALRAGARSFYQRVERQHLHLVGDLLDRFRLLAGDLIDLGGQPRDQRGNIGFILGARLIDRFAHGRSGAMERGRHRRTSSCVVLTRFRRINREGAHADTHSFFSE
jgi:hypothetical protein